MEMKNYLPGKWTIVSLVLCHFSMFHRSGGSYFALIALIPFFYDLSTTNKLSKVLGNCIALQLTLTYECFQWIFVPAANLWQKSFWETLLIFIFACPLTGLHIPLFGFFHYKLRKLIQPRWIFPLASASLYTLMDWSYVYVDTTFGVLLHQVPWLLSFAAFGSVYALTFFLVLSAEFFAFFFEGRKRMALVPTIIFIALSFLLRRSEIPGPAVNMTLVQSIDNPGENRQHFDIPEKRSYIGVKRTLEKLLAKKETTTLTVFPESFMAPYLYHPEDDRARASVNLFEEAHRQSQGAFLFGVVRPHENLLANDIEYREASGVSTFYRKRVLMPFGEQIPGANFFPYLYKIFYRPLVSVPGTNRTLFHLGEHKFSSVICNEIYYPWLVQDAVRDDADWLIHSGNETWLQGEPLGHASLLAAAKIRAVENGISIFKVANYGTTAVISPTGKIIKQFPLGELVIEKSNIPSGRQPTFFAKYPNLFLLLLALVLVTSILYSWRKKHA